MKLPSLEKKVNIRVATLESELDFSVKESTTGKRLFDQVVRTLCLREVWYFGLLFTNNKNEETWFNLNRKISSIDIKKTTPLLFEFRAKFFPEDCPKELIQDITTRLFFLQVKDSIMKNKLLCSPETTVLLTSYACQAKYGNYDSQTSSLNSIPLEKLLPSSIIKQHQLSPDEWRTMIARWYAEHLGMSQISAMQSYLELAQDLEEFGVDFFEIENKRKTPLLLGIDAMGMAIYLPSDKSSAKIGFPWSEISNISFTDKKFCIKPAEKTSPKFVFYTKEITSNKRILELCVGNNELYSRRRLPESMEVQQMRSQVDEERKVKLLEKDWLHKETEARIAAEKRVKELEAKLQKVYPTDKTRASTNLKKAKTDSQTDTTDSDNANTNYMFAITTLPSLPGISMNSVVPTVSQSKIFHKGDLCTEGFCETQSPVFPMTPELCDVSEVEPIYLNASIFHTNEKGETCEDTNSSSEHVVDKISTTCKLENGIENVNERHKFVNKPVVIHQNPLKPTPHIHSTSKASLSKDKDLKSIKLIRTNSIGLLNQNQCPTSVAQTSDLTKRPPFDLYKRPTAIIPSSSALHKPFFKQKPNFAKQRNGNAATNLEEIISSLDTSLDEEELKLTPRNLPEYKLVEFPPAVVPKLHSEELRQSVVSKDAVLRNKLQHLRDELQAKNIVACSENMDIGDSKDLNARNKFNTLRAIRRGNTKKRVEEFESF